MVVDKYITIKRKLVLIDNIPRGSNKKIRVRCDICNEIRDVFANQFFKRKTDLCVHCKGVLNKKIFTIGDNFGRWSVISMNGDKVKCECECGTIREVDKSSLLSGSSKSCGCVTKEKNHNRRIVLPIKSIFGRLVVIKESITSGKVICRCECDQVKEYAIGNLLNENTKSCGCYQKEIVAEKLREISRKQVGENHPNWQGGISGERARFDAKIETKKWRQGIYERDNFTCMCCGQVGYKLNVHHIQSYAEHPEVRLVQVNGITLCEECHRRFHKMFGRKNIGQEQIIEFLQKVA